jgi:hypothetical protein
LGLDRGLKKGKEKSTETTVAGNKKITGSVVIETWTRRRIVDVSIASRIKEEA